MGNPVTMRLGVELQAAGTVQQKLLKALRWAIPAAGGEGDLRQYTCASSAFQALTVPTWARYAILIIPAQSESLFLKNVTGDSTGIALTSATASEVNETLAVIPVDGTSPGLGILNSGNADVIVSVLML